MSGNQCIELAWLISRGKTSACVITRARRLLRNLVLHYTPIHGDWLNMGEIEIPIGGRECLRWWIRDRATLERQIAVLAAERNA